jgi:hypothetical protein
MGYTFNQVNDAITKGKTNVEDVVTYISEQTAVAKAT